MTTDAIPTLTSALGTRGPAIEDMALRLVAVVESSDDLTVRARAWVIADEIIAARATQRGEAEFGVHQPMPAETAALLPPVVSAGHPASSRHAVHQPTGD